jgi:hypothetical protein
MSLRVSTVVQMLVVGVLIAGLLGRSKAPSRTSVRSNAPPIVEVSADGFAYSVGDTVTLSFRTKRGRRSDVYVVLTTPSGRQLYADQTFRFLGQRTAAGRNISLADGSVDVPLSLSTSRLAHAGGYTVQVYVTPPGLGEEAGFLAGEVSFIVSLPGLNYLAIHDPESPQYDDNCAPCHVDKTRNVSLAPGVPSFHSMKYIQFGGDQVPKNCTYCHWGADLIHASQWALRKDVNPDFCNICHSASGPAKRLFGKPTPRP